MWTALSLAGIATIAVVLYVLWPLFRGQAPLIVQEDEQLEELLARKDATLRTIKDLQFDHKVGKIDDADFTRFNQSLRRRALALNQQIEQAAPEISQLDEQLEAEIAALHRVEMPLDSAASLAPNPQLQTDQK